MLQDNSSVILHKINDIRLEQKPIPKLTKGHVKIAVHSVGICGSDIHFWIHGRIGDSIVKSPMILGHETSGTVVELGEGVTNLKIGDRVAVEPGVPCYKCDQCMDGRYNLCPNVNFCGNPKKDGTLTRLYCHDANFCFKLLDNMTYEEGALLEPLSVGVHACRRAEVTGGDTILICGAGPIGLVTLLTARAFGATNIAITDINAKRLEFAKTLGVNHTILVDGDPQSTAKRAIELLGKMPDKSIDCVAFPPTISTAIYATKSGGTVLLVGLGPPTSEIPIVNASVREVDIKGVFRYKGCYQKAMDMIARGLINVKPLVTHRYAMEQALEAFEMTKSGEGIKVMIKCDPTRAQLK
ncbi:hypothetical protein LOD99_1632 [Oopsacas minuta]|uniref:Sorbitol dehydrogenase n=1 Tax=Oopsacas minuta TaxID=111878 RepID=A0AAV7K527_9METZ|nr:hypothetical protein LOD99_1632 [Oopsacas minuta]